MRTTRTTRQATALALLLALLPLAAGAHTGVDGGAHGHGFMAGFMHPLTGIDHLAAMIAVGLWSALTANRAGRTRRAGLDLLAAPFGFAVMLCIGAWMGMNGAQLPAVEPMIAASLLVLGLLVLTQRRLPALAAGALVGVFAVFHGVAHGQELHGAPDATLTIVGMLCATVMLHAAGIAIGWSLRHANHWLPRIAGASVALFGVALLGGLA